MAINVTAPDFTELKPRILVFGVGGAGGNAVNNMVASKLEGVEFLVANTDSQALVHSKAHHRLQIGTKLTQGLGAGSRPDVGQGAAEESSSEIKRILEASHMVFITAGMGGGTGTGAAPVIAKIARDLGILTVGVVTKPFSFEGQRRMRTAEEGIDRLKEIVDTLIVIPNQNLFRIANDKTTFAKAFEMADEVLYAGVRGVTDLMVMPGLINLDFADVRTVMSEMGTAMMGMGEAEGERRAVEAADLAISNPLLDVSSMKGARGVLINITGGMDLTLYEVDEAANKIRAEVDPEANIIVGSTFDERLNGKIRVSVVATGIALESRAVQAPTQQTAVAQRAGAGSLSSAEVKRALSMPSHVQPIAASTLTSSTSSASTNSIDSGAHPVHTMHTEIVRSGIVSGLIHEEQSSIAVCSTPQRPIGQVESNLFDPAMIESVGASMREHGMVQQPRSRPMAPLSTQSSSAETKKSSGFSVFGITIGGSSPSRKPAPPVQRPALDAPSSIRFSSMPMSQSDQSGPIPLSSSHSAQSRRSADGLMGGEDEQLDIPAFLRRQTN